jgi:hypothetical protein
VVTNLEPASERLPGHDSKNTFHPVSRRRVYRSPPDQNNRLSSPKPSTTSDTYAAENPHRFSNPANKHKELLGKAPNKPFGLSINSIYFFGQRQKQRFFVKIPGLKAYLVDSDQLPAPFLSGRLNRRRTNVRNTASPSGRKTTISCLLALNNSNRLVDVPNPSWLSLRG